MKKFDPTKSGIWPVVRPGIDWKPIFAAFLILLIFAVVLVVLFEVFGVGRVRG